MASLGVLIALSAAVACDVGGDEPATPTPEPTPVVTPTPAAPPTPAPTPTLVPTPTLSPEEIYLVTIRSIVTTLRALAPEISELVQNPNLDDGFWNVRIREMAAGLSSIFDRLVGRDPPDDWVRYHLTLVSDLGATADSLNLTVDSLAGLDFRTFTQALRRSNQAIERLTQTLQEYETQDPGAVPPIRTRTPTPAA